MAFAFEGSGINSNNERIGHVSKADPLVQPENISRKMSKSIMVMIISICICILFSIVLVVTLHCSRLSLFQSSSTNITVSEDDTISAQSVAFEVV